MSYELVLYHICAAPSQFLIGKGLHVNDWFWYNELLIFCNSLVWQYYKQSISVIMHSNGYWHA